jgi:hypothetical protein
MTSIFRPEYRQLDDFEKKKIEDIKAAAEAMYEAMNRRPEGAGRAFGMDRYHATAVTKLEEAVMWAVKGVTS